MGKHKNNKKQKQKQDKDIDKLINQAIQFQGHQPDILRSFITFILLTLSSTNDFVAR